MAGAGRHGLDVLSVGPARRLAGMVLAAVVLVAGGACASPPRHHVADPGPPPDPGAFSLVTYNVAGLPQEISAGRPGTNLPVIGQRLDAYDIVATQEDFDWWAPPLWLLDFANYHRRLREGLTHQYVTDAHPGPDGVDLQPQRPVLVGDGLGLASRFPISHVQRVPWRGCFGGPLPDGGSGDCLAMKGFMVATVQAGPHAFDLYDVHGEAGGAPEDQVLQAQQYDDLAAFIEQHSAGEAIVVVGDTNLRTDPTHPESGGGMDARIWERFTSRLGLQDACTPAAGCTDPDRIDRVAVRGGRAAQVCVDGYDVPTARFTDGDGAPLSDHDPVVVDLRLAGAGGPC